MNLCDSCGGATGAGTDRPPCLCDLSPLEPVATTEAAGADEPLAPPATAAPSESGAAAPSHAASAPDAAATPADPAAPQQKGGDTHAKALRCPSCGGWLEQGVRRCGYCRVELASQRCWRCFDLSFSGTSICAGCGATLGLEGDMGPSKDRCPGCDTDVLHVIVVGDHRIRECPACAGVMVDHDTLERITHAREAEAGVRMLGGGKKTELTIEPVRYRACPTCDQVMSRQNFGRRSGVIVDVCTDHGVWFDPDELTAVLAFVASGGMKETRQRELMDAKLELSKRRMDAIAEQSRMSRSVYENGRVHSGGALIGALVDFGW